MARTAITPQARAGKIFSAAIGTGEAPEIVTAYQLAATALAELGPAHPDTLAAWTIVEEIGATVHRQARLLAGKARGG